jgi:hypothetical protein
MVIPPMNDCIRNILSTPSFAPLDAPVGQTYVSITQESFNFVPNGVYFFATVVYTKRSSVLILLRGVYTSQEMLSLVNKCILLVFFIPMLVQGFVPRFPSCLIYYSTLVLVLGILFHLIHVFLSLTQLMEIPAMEILCLEQEKIQRNLMLICGKEGVISCVSPMAATWAQRSEGIWLLRIFCHGPDLPQDRAHQQQCHLVARRTAPRIFCAKLHQPTICVDSRGCATRSE